MIAVEPAAVPPPEPERPPTAGPADWVRHNLFRSTRDSIVTVVSALVVGYVIYRAVRYVFVTGRWEIVRVNLRLFMVGRYPSDELWRISVAIAVDRVLRRPRRRVRRPATGRHGTRAAGTGGPVVADRPRPRPGGSGRCSSGRPSSCRW